MTRLPLVLNQCTEFSDPSSAIGRWSFFSSSFFHFLFLFFLFFILFFFSPFLSPSFSPVGLLIQSGSIVSALSPSPHDRARAGEMGGGASRAKAQRAVVEPLSRCLLGEGRRCAPPPVPSRSVHRVTATRAAIPVAGRHHFSEVVVLHRLSFTPVPGPQLPSLSSTAWLPSSS
jgi:hypothetical protein